MPKLGPKTTKGKHKDTRNPMRFSKGTEGKSMYGRGLEGEIRKLNMISPCICIF